MHSPRGFGFGFGTVLYGNGSFQEKKDKISLGSKLLTKLMHDVGNSNDGNLFVQKPQTRRTVFKGFQMPPLSTTAFELSGKCRCCQLRHLNLVDFKYRRCQLR